MSHFKSLHSLVGIVQFLTIEMEDIVVGISLAFGRLLASLHHQVLSIFGEDELGDAFLPLPGGLTEDNEGRHVDRLDERDQQAVGEDVEATQTKRYGLLAEGQSDVTERRGRRRGGGLQVGGVDALH